jgi:hypothetical protein
MSVKTRLARLEQARDSCGPCDYRHGLLLDVGEPIPPDAPRCVRCGEVHVQWVEEVVIDSPEALAEFERRAAEEKTGR